MSRPSRRSTRRSLAAALAPLLLLAACSSSKLPERFHTLLPAVPPAAASAPAGSAEPLYIDVLPPSVPAQVDHPQWVVRQDDGSLLLLEQDRWAAPLQDELRGAIVARLGSRWGAVDVRSVAPPASAPWRVQVDVQRFESVPGREARIEATWSLSSARAGSRTLLCQGSWVEPAGADVAALAEAHRRAVARLADALGERLRLLQHGQPAGC